MLRLVVDHVSAGIANRSPHAPTVPARADGPVADRGASGDVQPVVPPSNRDRLHDDSAWSLHVDHYCRTCETPKQKLEHIGWWACPKCQPDVLKDDDPCAA